MICSGPVVRIKRDDLQQRIVAICHAGDVERDTLAERVTFVVVTLLENLNLIQVED